MATPDQIASALGIMAANTWRTDGSPEERAAWEQLFANADHRDILATIDRFAAQERFQQFKPALGLFGSVLREEREKRIGAPPEPPTRPDCTYCGGTGIVRIPCRTWTDEHGLRQYGPPGEPNTELELAPIPCTCPAGSEGRPLATYDQRQAAVQWCEDSLDAAWEHATVVVVGAVGRHMIPEAAKLRYTKAGPSTAYILRVYAEHVARESRPTPEP